MVPRSEVFVNTGEHAATLTRIINAPRELVFKAWTEAEHIAKWFGPKIFRAEVESDPRQGGKFRIAMIGLDSAPPEMKGPFPMKGEYIEFVRPERLVMTEDLTEHPDSWKEQIKNSIKDYKGEDFLHGKTIVTFEDMGEKTKVSITSIFPSDAVRDAYVTTGMNDGWNQSIDKLDDLLNKRGSVVRMLSFTQPANDVWRALTDSEAIAKWMYPNDFKPLVGHKFTLDVPGITINCEVLECNSPLKLKYSWTAGPVINSIVTYDLMAQADGSTLVIFEHSGFDLTQSWSNDVYGGAQYGWTMMHEKLSKLLAAK